MVHIPFNQASNAAKLGHEFKHIEEILETGMLLSERADEDRVWESSVEGWESQDAKDTESQIENEMRSFDGVDRFTLHWLCTGRECEIDSFEYIENVTARDR